METPLSRELIVSMIEPYIGIESFKSLLGLDGKYEK